MKPLLKLKQYFTIEEAAEHLSSFCDSPFSSRDVYQLVYDGDLPIACRFNRHNAVVVTPETTFRQLDPDDPASRPELLRSDDAGAGGLSEANQKPPADFSLRCFVGEYERKPSEIMELDGIFGLSLSGSHYLDYFKWLASGNDPREFSRIAPRGVCAYSATGTLLQPVKRATGSNNIWHVSTHTPEPVDFRILATDLLKLEAQSSVQPEGTAVNESPLHGKQRGHYLKVIAGLLSKAKIPKLQPVTEVQTMLEREGQSAIDRATLGKTLSEANALRK
jgi:hypothetical protein